LIDAQFANVEVAGSAVCYIPHTRRLGSVWTALGIASAFVGFESWDQKCDQTLPKHAHL